MSQLRTVRRNHTSRNCHSRKNHLYCPEKEYKCQGTVKAINWYCVLLLGTQLMAWISSQRDQLFFFSTDLKKRNQPKGHKLISSIYCPPKRPLKNMNKPTIIFCEYSIPLSPGVLWRLSDKDYAAPYGILWIILTIIHKWENMTWRRWSDFSIVGTLWSQ